MEEGAIVMVSLPMGEGAAVFDGSLPVVRKIRILQG